MKINMFNMSFGDCFLLEEGKKVLMVDCGMHKRSKSVQLKEDIYKEVIVFLKKYEYREFLITHFHQDHISGLIYIMNSPAKSFKFEKAYIPNIFSHHDLSKTIVLIFLEELMEQCYLPASKCNLSQFMKAMCGSISNVQLLERGDKFKNYRVLWPDKECVIKCGNALLDDIEAGRKDFCDELTQIAEDFRNAVYLILTEGDNNTRIIEQMQVIEETIKKLTEFQSKEETKEFLDELQKHKLKLNSFNNKISIVFHNEMDNDKNILFTGDVIDNDMKYIANDISYPLHKKYWCIKVPHHGTKEHFYDFLIYNPQKLLIPNGKCVGDAYKIHNAYKNKFTTLYDKSPFMYCSNCNWCEAWNDITKCDCKPSRKIVFNRYHAEIL